MATSLIDDSNIIKQSLDCVWNSKLSTVFKNKSLLKKILILAFDESKLFILTTKNLPKISVAPAKFFREYVLYEIKHEVSLEVDDFCGWWNGIHKKEFLKYLPKKLIEESQLLWPRVSGPMPSCFFKFHRKLKRKGMPFSPYTTPQSFQATIIHEFGHAYFDSTFRPWHGIREQNLILLNTALSQFSGNKVFSGRVNITPTSLMAPIASEIFAFCTEYFAAMLFFPKHKKKIDQEFQYFLPRLVNEEKIKDLNTQASVLDKNSHSTAAILGRLIISRYGPSWPNFFSFF